MLAALLPLLRLWGGRALAFLNSPVGRRALAVLAVLGLLWAVWLTGDHHGHAVEKARQAKALAAAEAKVAKTNAQAAQVANQIQTTTEKIRTLIQQQTVYLTKEVPIDVTPEADARCVVPAGFVSLYDNAASLPAIPTPARGPVDADSGVALSAVAETDAANLGAASQAISEVKAWRSWYVKEKALMEGGK